MIDYVFDIGIVRIGDGEPAGTLANIVPVFSSWYFPHFHLANSQTHLVVAKQSRGLVTLVTLNSVLQRWILSPYEPGSQEGGCQRNRLEDISYLSRY